MPLLHKVIGKIDHNALGATRAGEQVKNKRITDGENLPCLGMGIKKSGDLFKEVQPLPHDFLLVQYVYNLLRILRKPIGKVFIG